jgi:ribosomal protein L37AE/L43A
MRKDMWDLDVTGMKSSTSSTLALRHCAEAEHSSKKQRRFRCSYERACLLHNHPRYFMEQQRIHRGLRLMGKVKQHLLTDRPCIVCDSLYPKDRAALGYSTCMRCGEVLAKQRKHTVAPMHKSNYMLITDRADLRGINNKGGFFR